MTTSKNILFLVSRFLDGGIDTVLVEYVNSMVRLTDHNVTLAIGLDYGRDAEVFLKRIDERVEVKHIISNNILTYRKRHAHHNKKNALVSFTDEAALNYVRRRIEKHRIKKLINAHDVVIDFDSCHASYIPVKCEKTRIAFYHFSLAKEMERKPRRLKRFLKRLTHYDHVVTISDAMMQEAVSLCPNDSEKFCRIYNCIDIDKLQQKASCADEAVKTAPPYILAVERLEESQKDLTTLINAYAIAYSREPSLPHLFIIGEGRSRGELEQLIKSKRLEERVRLLGFKSNPLPWIKNARFIVHSAKFEGLPTVLIEALLLEKLIVSTDCPTGPREILNHGKAGILTPVGDADALADAIISATAADAATGAIIENIRCHKALFLPESSISKLQSLF